jgi:hypothetical protein
MDHSLDRIDGARGYEPGNVRWVTWGVQIRNRSNSLVMSGANGINVVMQDVAIENGIHPGTASNRLRRGWTRDAAASAPVDVRFRKNGESVPWSDADDTTLRASSSPEEAAAALGRSRSAVKVRAYRIGYAFGAHQWTPGEEAIVLGFSTAEAVERLGMSANAIRTKKCRLRKAMRERGE